MTCDLYNRYSDIKVTQLRFLLKRLKFSHGQPKYVVQDKMQHSIINCCISENQQARKAE